jgi:hypothetical protein
MTMSDRFGALAVTAPDIVAAWEGIETERVISVRREVRRRTAPGSAGRIVEQLEAVAAALVAVVETLPEHAFALAGGEEDWTVAQAIGHDADARAGLALAAALAARGRFPEDAPAVVPGIPGPPDATRELLVHRLQLSQRTIERCARSIAGHETDRCPLVHPLVGRLRCGEWLLFVGVHDLMHLEQVETIERALALAGSLGR